MLKYHVLPTNQKQTATTNIPPMNEYFRGVISSFVNISSISVIFML